MTETLNIWLGTSIIYVYGKVNEVETTFTLQGDGIWQAVVPTTEDNSYHIYIEAYSSSGLEEVYETTLYYGFTPAKTDWTAADFETAADFNRQKSNIEFVARDTLPGLYYFPEHTDIDDFADGDRPRIATINGLDGNTAGIETCGIPLPTEWGASKTWAAGGTNPDYEDFNRWELNAKLIYEMAPRIRISFKPSGTFAAGQSNILPRRVV